MNPRIAITSLALIVALLLALTIGAIVYRLPTATVNNEAHHVDTRQIESTETPAFKQIKTVGERKQQFFNYFAPIAHQLNQQVWQQRLALPSMTTAQLADLCAHYKASCNGTQTHDLDALRLHIDIVPVSLLLAQAANESAWGTSRFATDGNNYFGEWCYKPNCGLVPRHRAAGATNQVRIFASPSDSVASYIHNINTSAAYSELRQIRANLRAKQATLLGSKLAAGLTRYSERGDEYIDEIKSMISYNELARFDTE